MCSFVVLRLEKSHFVHGYIGNILKCLWEETDGKEIYDQNQSLCILRILGGFGWLIGLV